MIDADAVTLIADRLRAARGVVVLTGAGISAESGLRTFRGATGMDLPPDMHSLWKEFDPMKLATPEAFEGDPAMVSKWYDWRRLGCLAAEPNAGHLALAEMERHVQSHPPTPPLSSPRGGGIRSFTLLTQNVDRLHQRAGSRNVVELHGTIMEWRCTRTGRPFAPPETAFERYPVPSPFSQAALLRPNVVWFGEMLPTAALDAADEALASCDVFISIGTSAVVYPAAGFIRAAAARGAFTVEINKEATPISGAVDVAVQGGAGEVLPLVAAAMRRSH